MRVRGEQPKAGNVAEQSEATTRSPTLVERLGAAARTTPILILLWAAALAYMAMTFVGLPERATRWDFSHYYVSAWAMRQGGNAYYEKLRPAAQQLGLRVEEIDRATYPPTFLLLFEPLTLMRPTVAYWTWIGINTIALAAALYLMLGWASGLDARSALAAAAAAIIYLPLNNHFYYAQCQILVLLGVAAMVRLIERRRDAAAGVVLALCALLRVFPIFLLGYFIMRRKWRVVMFTVIAVTAGGAATIAGLGFGRTLSFVHALGFLASDYWLARPANVALAAFIMRQFGYLFGPHPQWAAILARRSVTVLCQLGVLALTIRATLAAGRDDDRFWRALSLWVVTAIMLSPTAWLHYMVLILFLYAQLIVAAFNGAASTRALWAGLASYLLVNLGPLAVLRVINLGAIAVQGPAVRPALGNFALIDLATEFEFATLVAAFAAAYWLASDSPRGATILYDTSAPALSLRRA